MSAGVAGVVTVLAWGLWLFPAQGVISASPVVTIFYATFANLLVAAGVVYVRAEAGFTLPVVSCSFAAGVLWTLGGICAFSATRRLGTARAMGLWAPLNILCSLAWGVALFGEFRDTPLLRLLVVALAIALLLGGLNRLIASGAERGEQHSCAGLVWAATTGVLWGSYFIPIQAFGISPWLAALPMAIGMVVTATAAVLIGGHSLRLEPRSAPVRLALCGLLWCAGNYASLLLMEALGTGRGFSIAQLCLVVNALAGIYVLRQPPPRTPASRNVLLGCTLASVGGITLGLVN